MAKKKAGPPATRKIDGKNYKRSGGACNKTEAKNRAKRARKAGSKARVVKSANGKYGCYTRGGR